VTVANQDTKNITVGTPEHITPNMPFVHKDYSEPVILENYRHKKNFESREVTLCKRNSHF
jgi:hypothetical protein